MNIKMKSMPGAILGIIGGVFAIIGGISLVMCADLVSGITGGGVNLSWAAYVFGLGGGVVGLVGAVLDFNKPIIGGVLQFVAAVLLLVACIVLYWQWAVIVSMVLFVVGGILSFVLKKEA